MKVAKQTKRWLTNKLGKTASPVEKADRDDKLKPGWDLPAKTWRDDQARDQLDVLFVGDTSFGENYQEKREAAGKGNILKDQGHEYCLERVAPMMQKADLVVANLETPLTRLPSTPLEGRRPYLHKSDPDDTIHHLLANNVNVVKMANNHSADYGVQGLVDTLNFLKEGGIVGIGAGHNLKESREPFRLRARLAAPDPETKPENFRLRVYSVYHGGREFTEEIHEHASEDRPGSAPLKVGYLAKRIQTVKARHPNEVIVVCPHWRRDYKWRSERQLRSAQRLVEAGADVIIGHGSHMMQELEKIDGSWVVHGIGNFVFNSPGRYRLMEAPPYGLAARMTASFGNTVLRLYPILLDNRRTKFQTRPVTEAEFVDVVKEQSERTNDAEAFAADFTQEHDDIGWHLQLQLRGQDTA